MTGFDAMLTDALRNGRRSVCAVADLGCAMNDTRRAGDNVKRINDYFDALETPGVIGALSFPCGNLFTRGEVRDPIKTSVAVLGGASSGYILGDSAHAKGVPGGSLTKIVRLRDDAQKEDDGSAVWRLRGSQSLYSGLMFQGRRKPDRYDAGEGPRTNHGLLIEGRTGTGAEPPSGNHLIVNCAIVDCATAIFNPPDPVEAHGDSCTFQHIAACGFDTFYRSTNQQAIGHTFDNVTLYPYASTAATAFDVERGGYLHARGIHLNGPQFTLLKLKDYSPNTARFDVDFRWDTPAVAPSGLTLLDMENATDAPFGVRLSGLIAGMPGRDYDARTLFRFAEGASQQEADLRVDVTNLPQPWARRYAR